MGYEALVHKEFENIFIPSVPSAISSGRACIQRSSGYRPDRQHPRLADRNARLGPIPCLGHRYRLGLARRGSSNRFSGRPLSQSTRRTLLRLDLVDLYHLSWPSGNRPYRNAGALKQPRYPGRSAFGSSSESPVGRVGNTRWIERGLPPTRNYCYVPMIVSQPSSASCRTALVSGFETTSLSTRSSDDSPALPRPVRQILWRHARAVV